MAIAPFTLNAPGIPAEFRTDPKQAITQARALMKTAALTGDHDRDSLYAMRTVRDALFDNPGSVSLWKTGLQVFAHQRNLMRKAGQKPPATEDVNKFPDLAQAMSQASNLVKQGGQTNLRQALSLYYQAMNTGGEYEPLWRAGLAAAEALRAAK